MYSNGRACVVWSQLSPHARLPAFMHGSLLCWTECVQFLWKMKKNMKSCHVYCRCPCLPLSLAVSLSLSLSPPCLPLFILIFVFFILFLCIQARRLLDLLPLLQHSSSPLSFTIQILKENHIWYWKTNGVVRASVDEKKMSNIACFAICNYIACSVTLLYTTTATILYDDTLIFTVYHLILPQGEGFGN